MTTELRETGISVVGGIPWGTHFCHFYETKEDLLDILIPYFKTGLENNEFCMWVVSELLGMDEAANALRGAFPEADRYLSSGSMKIVPHPFHLFRQQASPADSIEIVPYTEWYLRNGVFNAKLIIDGWREKLDEALARGYAGMRANGDEAWLTKENWEDFGRYEKALDEALAGQRMVVLCSYPLSEAGAAEILDVVRTHQFAVARRDRRWEIVEAPELKEAKAEISRLNEELERRVVERTRELEAANEKLREEIAERKLAEEALRESEVHLRLVTDTIPALVWSALPDGSLDFINQRHREFTGLSLDDVRGWRWTAVIHPEDRTGLIGKWRAALATGEPVETEVRLRRATGDYRWLLVRAVPLRDETGKIVKWYGTKTDIEDRKQVEERLRQIERELRLIINTIPANAWSALPDGAIDFANQRVLKDLGLSFQDLAGWNWTSIVHTEDATDFVNKWRASLASHKPMEVEARVRRADGEYRWYLIRNVPLKNDAGNVVRWYGTGVDITEHKRAEEALRESQQLLQLVLATLPVGVIEMDLAGDIVLVNAASKRIWGDIIVSGRQRWAQTSGFWHNSGERIAPTDWASVRALSEGQTSLNELIDIETYDGQQKTIENSAAPIHNAEGQIVGAVVVNEDVTERVRAEEQLKRSNEELRALSARLHSVREEESARIAREIHDELGGAMSSLKWDMEEIGEILSESTDPPRLAALRERVGAMITLTDNTVDAVRRISSELRPTALAEFGLVEALRWHAQQFQARTGITVHCDCPPESAELNREQATAVFRIVQEALTNVLRHARATRVDINIRSEGGRCVLTVSDNGRGITEAEKTGLQSLGMLGMRERAHLLGGEINVEGVEGRGTVVTLRVPAHG
jgi:PAS domain S-box-containing protein